MKGSRPGNPGAGDGEAGRVLLARRTMISAARRVNVSSRIRPASAPEVIRWATRCARVLVLPVPAPAMISRGEKSCVTAAACPGLRAIVPEYIPNIIRHQLCCLQTRQTPRTSSLFCTFAENGAITRLLPAIPFPLYAGVTMCASWALVAEVKTGRETQADWRGSLWVYLSPRDQLPAISRHK